MIYFAVRQRFDRTHEGWPSFVRWLGRTDLERVISLDCMLCPSLLSWATPDDWEHAVTEGDQLLPHVADLSFARRKCRSEPRSMLLAVAKHPTPADLAGFRQPGFVLAGFDLVDTDFSMSALLNCGGFPEVFSVSELSSSTGLLTSRERAFAIRDALGASYPDDPHAQCDVWAIWREAEAAGSNSCSQPSRR